MDCVAYPRQLTLTQLLYLGIDQVVYLKVGAFDGEQGYMIYSADGRPLEIVGTVETAIEMVAESGLHFVRVH